MKIGFVGTGKMAEAIVAALIRSRTADAHRVFASDVIEARRRHIRRAYGINTYKSNRSVASSVDVLFLAVKPQELESVLSEIAGDVTERHLVISIAAGKTVGFVEALLPGARVLRVMPNLPATVGAGVTALCSGASAKAADLKTAEALLSSFGVVLQLPEELFDAVTALSGSGPAFLACLLSWMIEGGVELGLGKDDATSLAVQTMLGTARVLQETGTSPQALVEAVTSKKGTTEAGLQVLRRSATASALKRTLAAAAQRSRELSA